MSVRLHREVITAWVYADGSRGVEVAIGRMDDRASPWNFTPAQAERFARELLEAARDVRAARLRPPAEGFPAPTLDRIAPPPHDPNGPGGEYRPPPRPDLT